MRYAIFVVALVAGCVSDNLGETSFGSVTGTPAVRFARGTHGLTSYGGIE